VNISDAPERETHPIPWLQTLESLLALGYGSKRRLREKRKNVNCAEDIVTDIGSK
jgi:hypothetical protein